MITADDIKNLAHLARMDVLPEEVEKLAKDMNGILGYVGEVSAVVEELKEKNSEAGPLRNIFRDDLPAHERGEYTEAILANAPVKTDGFIKVKKIL